MMPDMEEKHETPVKVAIRVRPFVGKERILNPGFCLSLFPGKRQLILGKDRQFTFDLLFGEDASQEDVYKSCVQQLVQKCFDGYNATVFAYGQTGSGKTYTMGTGNLSDILESSYGILPRAINEIFQHIQDKTTEGDNKGILKKQKPRVKVSFIEIYMEEVRDLLSSEPAASELHIRDDEHGNTAVPGLHEETVTSVDEVMNCLEFGTAARHTANTKMNEDSSRSHCIFTISIEQFSQSQPTGTEGKISGRGGVITAKLKVVDLAGSERAHRTGNQGERFRESVFINSGLLALGNVISALSDTKRKNAHIPYRDSKLTRLLKDSLGGNSNTVMITCISPSTADFDENLNSLKFSTRARSIRNTPVINRDLQQTQVFQMKEEIAALRQELSRHNSGTAVGIQKTSGGTDTPDVRSLQSELERCRSEISLYLHQIDAADRIFSSCERALDVTHQLHEQIRQWKASLKTMDMQSTEPLKFAGIFLENLNVCNNDLANIQESLKEKTKENINLKSKIDSLQAENTKLMDEISELSQNKNTLQGYVLEQQFQLQTAEQRPTTAGLKREEEKLLKSFRARSEVLLSRIEDLDEVCHDSSDTLGDTGTLTNGSIYGDVLLDADSALNRHHMTEDSLGTILNGGDWSPGKRRHASEVHMSRSRSPTKRTGFNFRSSNTDILTSYRHGNEASEKKLGGIEREIQDVSKELNTLSSIIRQKEELAQIMSHNDKEAHEITPIMEERLKAWKKESDRMTRELEDARQRLLEYEKRSHVNAEERHRVESEYKKKIATLDDRLGSLEKNQKEAKKMYSLRDNSEKRMDDLEGHIERLRGQQDQLQKKLKTEKEMKLKLEAEVKRGEQKIKELQLKTDSQQRILKRKTEEIAAAQRKLRVGSGKMDSRNGTKVEDQKKWLDLELEKMLKRKEEIAELEEDLQRRQEILEKREALLHEKDVIEHMKVRSSQVIFKDIVRLSNRVDDLNKEISDVEERSATPKDKERTQEEIANLLNTKADLEKQQRSLQKRIENDEIMDAIEERRLKEVVEGIEALDVAIEYKTELILERQNAVSESEATEDWINSLLLKLGEISVDESKALLRKYLEKVVTLKESESKAKLEREMIEVQMEEQEMKIHQLEHFLKLSESRAEKIRVDQQLEYEEKITYLLSQVRENCQKTDEDTLRAQDKKIRVLEKELLHYRKSLRDSKRKLREVTDSASLTSSVTDPQITERVSHVKGNDKVKMSSEGLKEERGRNSIRESSDSLRFKNQNHLDDINALQNKDSYIRKDPVSWATNISSRDTDILQFRARAMSEPVREDGGKSGGSPVREGADFFRLPPVQGSLKDTKTSRDRAKEQSGHRQFMERQGSDENQMLKEVLESHLSQRSARKEGRQLSDQDASSRKWSLPKGHEDGTENYGNPWQ